MDKKHLVQAVANKRNESKRKLWPCSLTRLDALRVLDSSLSCRTRAVEEPGCLVALCAAANAVCGLRFESAKTAAVWSVCDVEPGLLSLASVWEAELLLTASPSLEVEAAWVAAAELLLVLEAALESELESELAEDKDDAASSGGVAKVASSKWALASRMSDLEYSAEGSCLITQLALGQVQSTA